MPFQHVRIPFGSQSQETRTREHSPERLINCYYERAMSRTAKSPSAVYQRGGLVQAASGLNGACRGVYRFKGEPYFVMGTKLYHLDSDEAATAVGDIPGHLPTTGDATETELAICSEPNGFVYDGDRLTQITSADFPTTVKTCAVADGYAVWSTGSFGQWSISRNRDLTKYEGLDFASAERRADGLVRVFWNHGELLLFGERTLEVYQNVGALDFPFQRVNNVVPERGCIAPYSVTNIDNSVCWVGNDRIVYRLNEYTPMRISTHAVETWLKGLGQSQIAALEAFSYDWFGHKFYGLQSPARTFVYDAATGFWHEYETYQKKNWYGSYTVEAHGNVYCGSRLSGEIFRIDPDTNTDNSLTMVREGITPTLHQFPARISVAQLELDVDTGNTALGDTEAQIMLRASTNAGRTWFPTAWRTRGLGAQGEYAKRVRFMRWGQGQEFVWNWRVTDDVKFTLLGASALVEARRP